MTAINKKSNMSHWTTLTNRIPRTRWVHVLPDNSEKDFDYEPEGLLTICVTAEPQVDPRWIDESTRTFLNDGEPAVPPGKGWRQGLRIKTGHWWYRRRWL